VLAPEAEAVPVLPAHAMRCCAGARSEADTARIAAETGRELPARCLARAASRAAAASAAGVIARGGGGRLGRTACCFC